MRVVVIGGGHAGCEAAAALRRMGLEVVMVTHNFETIGSMSCNPAVGGLAKAHVVKEIDALGGIQGLIADQSSIQRKYLNSSKGPAVRATRIQADKRVFATQMQKLLVELGVQIVQDEFCHPVVIGSKITGVNLRLNGFLATSCVVVTTGTFLRGLMHFGEAKVKGGRFADVESSEFSSWLQAEGIKTRRLKTGTPPRILRSSIDFSVMEAQWGDEYSRGFHWATGSKHYLRQVPCYLTHTNTQTHQIIAEARERSPIYNGSIEGVGPRYCPSIEDKVFRFADRERHQVFVEPEGVDSPDFYPNGISTSLPVDVQQAFVRTIKGLENAVFTRPGYAVEYDSIDSSQLDRSLQFKGIAGLFFAGQINGTSGYEEAAGQGLVAGVNAGCFSKGIAAWYPDRTDSYLGVMVDDLTKWGPDEPYRLFSSRAEARLILREDNAFDRLGRLGRQLGLVSDDQWVYFNRLSERESRFEGFLKSHRSGVKNKTLFEQIKEPGVSSGRFWKEFGEPQGLQDDPLIWERVDTRIKYSGYLDREDQIWSAIRAAGTTRIPDTFDFRAVGGLSNEMVDKITQASPRTVADLQMINGVSPAATAAVYISLKRHSSSAARL